MVVLNNATSSATEKFSALNSNLTIVANYDAEHFTNAVNYSMHGLDTTIFSTDADNIKSLHIENMPKLEKI